MSRCARVVVAVAAVVVASIGSACAGRDGGDKKSATGTTALDTGTALRRAIDPAAQARAESMLLSLSDLPDGWRGSPSEDDNKGDEEFRRCLNADYSAFTLTGDADSDEFSMGESTTVSSDARVLESEADAQGSLDEFADAMRSPAAEDCFGEIIRDAIQGEDYELGDVDVGELSFTSPPNVDEVRAWQVAIPLESTSGEGLSPTIYLDLVYLREGDVLASVTTEDVLSAFDAELRKELVKVVAGRTSE